VLRLVKRGYTGAVPKAGLGLDEPSGRGGGEGVEGHVS